jgi:hypothetical protein
MRGCWISKPPQRLTKLTTQETGKIGRMKTNARPNAREAGKIGRMKTNARPNARKTGKIGRPAGRRKCTARFRRENNQKQGVRRGVENAPPDSEGKTTKSRASGGASKMHRPIQQEKPTKNGAVGGASKTKGPTQGHGDDQNKAFALALDREIQMDDSYVIPKAIQLKNVPSHTLCQRNSNT